MLKRAIKRYQMMSLTVKAAFWYTACNILQKGISLISVPIYTRLLTTEQYGIYTTFLTWLELFEIVATLRLSWGGYIVGLTKYADDRGRYTSSLQSLGAIITTVVLLVYLAMPNIWNRFTGLTTGMMILMFVSLYTTPATEFWSSRQRAENHYIAMVAVTITSSLLIPTLSIVALLNVARTSTTVIAVRIIVQGLMGVVLLWVNIRKRPVFYDKKYWSNAFRFNIPLIPYYLSTMLLNHSDRIVIQQLVGAAQAGIYSVAYSAAMVMQLFSNALNSSLQPWFFRKMKEKRYQDISGTINMAILVIGAINLLLIAFAPEAIALLAPPSYHEAIWIIPPVTASVFVMFLYSGFLNVEFYFEEGKLIAAASIGAAVLNLMLNFMFIPIYGYIAAGYTTLFSYLVFAVVHYIFMVKVCKRNICPINIFEIKFMVISLVSFLLLTAIMTVGYQLPVIRYGTVIIIMFFMWYKRKYLLTLLHSIGK